MSPWLSDWSFDHRGSVGGAIGPEAAARLFLDTSNPHDEFFLTQDPEEVQSRVFMVKSLDGHCTTP